MEDGVIHEKDVVKDKKFEEVSILNPKEGFSKTLDLMKKGVELIYQGVLFHEDYIGRPDLLEKREGKSNFGDHYYVAIDIKSGKRLKVEYKTQMVFYSWLLEKIQGVLPETAYVINSEKVMLEFEIANEMERFIENLDKVRNIVDGNLPEPCYNGGCSECVWREVCVPLMVKKGEISLLPGLGKVVKKRLTNAGLTSIKDIAECKEEEVNEVKMAKFIRQAKSIVEDRVIVIREPNLYQPKVEIFFDIEGETELGIDYLYGLLVREGGKEQFFPIWADKPEDEEQMWNEFMEFMSKIKDFRMYHYTSYEVSSLKKLKEKYGCDEQLFDRIKDSCVDLHRVLLKTAVMPLHSYSIKDVAKYIGFRWREKNACGSQSLFWYFLWLDTGEEKWKQTIIDYNEDDVRATKILKDWLTNL